MSGEKDTIVNLRHLEYYRMMQSCSRLDNVENSVRSNMDRMASGLGTELNNRISSINTRHSKLEHHVSGMSQEMQLMEKEQSRHMREQTSILQQGLASLGQFMNNQRQEYTTIIREQGEQFHEALQIQGRMLEGRIRNIQKTLIQKEVSERDQAHQWFNDSQRYLDMIKNEYKHEKFKPGALNHIAIEMSMSHGNLDHGNYQAAIATSQQSLIRASELRLELEKLEMEWEAHLQGAKQNATEVLATCDAQTACRFTLEMDQGAEDVAGEVDFWTNGALSELRRRVEAQLKQLGTPEDISLENLKASIALSDQWREQCLELAEKAKEALLASQLRNNLGQMIEDSMLQAGWELTDATYEGEDFRGAVHIKMQNLPGDEIVTIISPEPGEGNTIHNKLNISFFDRSTNDEIFRQERLQAITGLLQEEGLEIGLPVCRQGTENQPCIDNAKLDFQKVRQSKYINSF